MSFRNCQMALVILAAAWCPPSHGFLTVPTHKPGLYPLQALNQHDNSSNNEASSNSISRLDFLSQSIVGLSVGVFSSPQSASAGVDVSGLRVEGSNNNAALANQLKAYDGSGSARVREVQSLQQGSSVSPPKSVASVVDDRAPIAMWAYRANPGIGATVARAGALGTWYRYNDSVVASKRRSVGIQFEFPSDWLQLDKMSGGIQYVDQRNGDKLYVFRAPLADGQNLASLSKATIGDWIFHPQSSLIQTGQTVEDYKVKSAQLLSDCPTGTCATRRRFQIKYATVTGNGLRVERRALVDAYQVDDQDVYMLMTSSNAVKFEQQDSRERETVERIVSSFQLTNL